MYVQDLIEIVFFPALPRYQYKLGDLLIACTQDATGEKYLHRHSLTRKHCESITI